MSILKTHSFFSFFLTLMLLIGGCTDDAVKLPVLTSDEEQTDNSLLYHDGTRMHPYPKMNNEIFESCSFDGAFVYEKG